MLLAKIRMPYAKRFLIDASTTFTTSLRNSSVLRTTSLSEFSSNRRFINSISDKIINKGIQTIIYGCEYMPIVLMAGTGVGTSIGSYHGYQESKKDTYLQCIFTTVIFGWFGGVSGYLLTMFCPVTVPIVIVATIARQMEPTIIEPEPEKKESDIYALHDKRPT